MEKLKTLLQQQGLFRPIESSNPWNQLVQFESVDIVKDRLLDQGAQADLDTSAFDIATHFAQGRQFFESAESSSPLIRPLLLYYGVLGMSRGLILFKSAVSGTSGLSRGHGLREVEWERTLSQESKSVLALRIQVSKGSFSDLAATLGNMEKTTVYDWDRGLYEVSTRGSSTYPGKYIFKVDEILSRITDLHDIYELVTGMPSSALPAYVRVLPRVQSDYYILDPKRQVVDIKELLLSIGIDPDFNSDLEFSDYEYPVGDINNLHFIADSETSPRSIGNYSAPLRGDSSGMVFLVKHMPEKVNLSSLSLLFAASFIQGMLARYFPSRWALIQSKGPGDRYQLLLTSASEAVRTRYPSLVLEHLLDDFNYHPFDSPSQSQSQDFSSV